MQIQELLIMLIDFQQSVQLCRSHLHFFLGAIFHGCSQVASLLCRMMTSASVVLDRYINRRHRAQHQTFLNLFHRSGTRLLTKYALMYPLYVTCKAKEQVAATNGSAILHIELWPEIEFPDKLKKN